MQREAKFNENESSCPAPSAWSSCSASTSLMARAAKRKPRLRAGEAGDAKSGLWLCGVSLHSEGDAPAVYSASKEATRKGPQVRTIGSGSFGTRKRQLEHLLLPVTPCYPHPASLICVIAPMHRGKMVELKREWSQG